MDYIILGGKANRRELERCQPSINRTWVFEIVINRTWIFEVVINRTWVFEVVINRTWVFEIVINRTWAMYRHLPLDGRHSFDCL